MPHPACTVLVVDDEPAIRQILCRSISAAGFAVIDAVDGADALRKLECRPVDIVITDIQMPNVDGLQLLKEVRARWAATAVILITGNRVEGPAGEIAQAGADDVIRKPFHNHDIVRQLTCCWQRRSDRQPHSGNRTP